MDLGTYGIVIFWLIVATVVLYELHEIIVGKSSNKWRRHAADVIEVTVETRVDDGSEESRPKIKYRYQYRGNEYVGIKVRYGNLWSSDYIKSHDMLFGIVKGSEIEIFINPKCPKQSVLYRGYEGNAFCTMLLYSLFIFIAILF